MMKILANENIPATVVDGLRAVGYDVSWIRAIAPGATDVQVMELASAEERTIVTFDKDFGELAFRSGMRATSGIILLRLTLMAPIELAEMIASVLASRQDWVGHFAVVEEKRIRMTPLPP